MSFDTRLNACPACGAMLESSAGDGAQNGSTCGSCDYTQPKNNNVNIARLQNTLAHYSKDLGANQFYIGGAEFSASSTFAANGLMPLFIRRAQQVLNYANFTSISNSLGFHVVADNKALVGERCIASNDSPNMALTLLALADVVHERLDISKRIQMSNTISPAGNSVSLDGMLDTSELQDIGQNSKLEESALSSSNPFMIAARKSNW